MNAFVLVRQPSSHSLRGPPLEEGGDLLRQEEPCRSLVVGLGDGGGQQPDVFGSESARERSPPEALRFAAHS